MNSDKLIAPGVEATCLLLDGETLVVVVTFIDSGHQLITYIHVKIKENKYNFYRSVIKSNRNTKERT